MSHRWGAAHDHAVSFYDQDDEAVSAVAAFVVGALLQGGRAVVVATADHLAALDDLLRQQETDPASARRSGRLTTLDAVEVLDRFMVDGLPDPERFHTTIGGIVERARGHLPSVRVFGEMVSVLWHRGNVVGALALESLWNDLARNQRFELLCAYAIGELAGSDLGDVRRVCEQHSSVLPPTSYLSIPPFAGGSADAQRSSVFLPVPEAVRGARRFVTSVLELWGEDRLVPDAALVTSEMTTNALRHANSPFRLTVDRSEVVVRITVEDLDAERRPRVRVAAPLDFNGRGVAIVEEIASSWGSRVLPHGKIVWAELG